MTRSTTYPDAVAVETSWAVAVIAVSILAPLVTMAVVGIGTRWATLPLLAVVAIGLTAAWRSVRRITPDVVGGTGALALIPVLAIGTALMGLVTIVAMVVKPANPIFIAFPALPFALGLLVGLDLATRGYVHGWMQRVGFGRTFRMVVPAVLAALVVVPVDPKGVLPVALLLGSAGGGLVRETVGGLSYLAVVPVALLLALFLMTL